MIIGFTGTQRGMTPRQLAAFPLVIPSSTHEAHHGDCIGRSGTWATIRNVRRLQKPIITIYPDGEVEELAK